MEYIFLAIILLFSIVIHEVSHGAMANFLGDPTAKLAGRLTLNPLKHLDPIGSVILPLFLIVIKSPLLIGFAKPVPINPYNFRDQKYGSAKSALAGPAANIALALFFGLILRFLPHSLLGQGITLMFAYIVYINLLLAFFNLIPIPPLDGSHVLFTFLPPSLQQYKAVLSQYGFFILIFLLLFFPTLLNFLSYLISLFFSLIVGTAPLLY